MAIRHPYGETISQGIIIDGADFSDAAVLLVVRDLDGNVIWWHTYVPVETAKGWLITWQMEHDLVESILPVGTYIWGVSVYRNPVFDEYGMPIDGFPVDIPIPRSTLKIIDATSREEGIDG
jgi:hypothetical protein